MKRKIWIAIAVAVLLLTSAALAKGEYKTVEVFFNKFGLKINGQPSSNQIDGLIYNGTIYMPVSVFGETMNGQVTWNSTDNTVDIDFIRPGYDPVIGAANDAIYQYIAIEKNQIMGDIAKAIKKGNYSAMKNELARLQQLEELAGNIGDDPLKKLFNRLTFSGEVIRSGLSTKPGKDYKMAVQLFTEADAGVTKHLVDKLSAKAIK